MITIISILLIVGLACLLLAAIIGFSPVLLVVLITAPFIITFSIGKNSGRKEK